MASWVGDEGDEDDDCNEFEGGEAEMRDRGGGGQIERYKEIW